MLTILNIFFQLKKKQYKIKSLFISKLIETINESIEGQRTDETDVDYLRTETRLKSDQYVRDATTYANRYSAPTLSLNLDDYDGTE